MFVVLAVILGIVWVLGFAVVKVGSAAIHVLLLVAVISLITHVVRRGSKPA